MAIQAPMAGEANHGQRAAPWAQTPCTKPQIVYIFCKRVLAEGCGRRAACGCVARSLPARRVRARARAVRDASQRQARPAEQARSMP